eukprot:232479-Heterocapsa_arctica.AAC.1
MISLASSLDSLTAPNLLNMFLCIGLVARKKAMCSIFNSALACLQKELRFQPAITTTASPSTSLVMRSATACVLK